MIPLVLSTLILLALTTRAPSFDQFTIPSLPANFNREIASKVSSSFPQISIPKISIPTPTAPSLLLAGYPSISSPITASAPTSTQFDITMPNIDFSFPTEKLTKASSVFGTTVPSYASTTTSTTSNSLFSNSTFGGFSDSYKAEMAYLIASISELNTTEGRLLTDKLTIDLISIDNTLRLINMDKSREQELKPLLQFQVKQFLSDMDLVQEYMSRQSSSVVIGDSNYVAGKGTVVTGDNNAVVGKNNAVIGSNNALLGNQTLISGFNNGVKGNNAVAVGVNNSVNANNTYVFANNDVVSKDNVLVVRNTSIDLGKLIGGGSYLQRS